MTYSCNKLVSIQSSVLFTGNGTYVHIETSWPRKPNDTARLVSPPIAPNSRPGNCLQFWYHMYGPDIDTLSVYIKDGGVLGNPIWQRKGNQGNVWKYGQFFIRRPSSYKVQGFENMKFKNFVLCCLYILLKIFAASSISNFISPFTFISIFFILNLSTRALNEYVS